MAVPPYNVLLQEWRAVKSKTCKDPPYTVLLAEWSKAHPGEDAPAYALLASEMRQKKLQNALPYNVLVKEYLEMYPPPKKTVLLATEKAFAAEAVGKIETIFTGAQYALKKLENYKKVEELHEAVRNVDAIIIRSDVIDKAAIDKAGKCKIVVRAGAGYDNIDLEACTRRGVVAMNTPGQNANAVAELVIGMMLTSARNNFDGTSGFELGGRKLALYGFGAVARAVHKLAKVFGMETFAYDPFLDDATIKAGGATPVASVEALFACQYVSLHVPLTAETKDSINKALLSKMPHGATLINSARPEVVHEGDLLELVKERPDFCYLCDVPPKNADEIKAAVGDKDGKRIVFTKKKMGAQTLEANNNAGVAAANQIVGFFEKGVAKFQVNKSPKKMVLLATEKAFAAEAVGKIEKVFADAQYALKKLENYKKVGELHEAVRDVDAIIIRSDVIDKAALDKAGKCKIVVRAGAGYDNIDLEACTSRGVVAMNTPGQNANAVAELVIGMMLTSARNNFDGTSGFELGGRKLALYGFGAVARAVHKLAKVFGMETFAYDPFLDDATIKAGGATPVASVEALFACQYVSLHVPLTAETKDSINKALLSKMPQGATLINSARPEVVHEGDLLELVKERPDFCYLCDVPPKNADEIKAAVGDKDGKRIVFTKKKMGAQTLEANNNAGVAAANQIVGFFERGDAKFQLNTPPLNKGELPSSMCARKFACAVQ